MRLGRVGGQRCRRRCGCRNACNICLFQVQVQLGQSAATDCGGTGKGVGKPSWGRAFLFCSLGASAGLIQGVGWLQRAAQIRDTSPFGALSVGELEYFSGDGLECFAILSFGVNLGELDMDGHALGVVAQSFFEDFLGLHIAAIRQIDICFGHRVDVAARVELARRVRHGRCPRAQVALGGVHALATAGAKKRITLQAAFHDGGVSEILLAGAFACNAVGAIAEQQGQQSTDGWQQRLLEKAGHEAGLRLRLRGRYRWLLGAGCGG